MHDDHRAVVEIGKQIFRAATEMHDAAAGDPVREAGRKGFPQIRPPLLDLVDHGAFHDRGQPTAHGLDFRQFRHVLS